MNYYRVASDLTEAQWSALLDLDEATDAIYPGGRYGIRKTTMKALFNRELVFGNGVGGYNITPDGRKVANALG